MRRPNSRTLGIALAAVLLYIIGGPVLAEAAMPVFQSTLTGSCMAVVTESGCCQDTHAAVGSPWGPVYAALSIPEAFADEFMDSGFQCFCSRPTIRWEPRSHEGVCRMEPVNWGIAVMARCGPNSELVINNTGEASYEVWSVTVDGTEIRSATGRFIIPPNGNRSLDHRTLGGNHTVAVTAQAEGYGDLWTITDRISCP